MQRQVFIPNETVLRNILSNLEKEYNLADRLAKYPTYSPEWISFATEKGLSAETASKALFVADFIITSSVLPSGCTDEDRYRTVVNIFILGQKRCESPDKLLKIIYLAYKTAVEIRSQDAFMGDRGIIREISLLRLKDAYITPYLWVAAEILGEGPAGWELGVISAALQREYPDAEIGAFGQASSHKSAKDLTRYIWDLLKRYQMHHTIQKKEIVSVPNFNESQGIVIFDSNRPGYLAAWSRKSQINLETIQDELKNLIKALDKQIGEYSFVSLRGRIGNSSNDFFIVRNPFISSKSVFVLVTPADDLNLTKILTILQFRGEEREGWQDTLGKSGKPIIAKMDVTQPISKEMTPSKSLSDSGSSKQKPGLFGRIFGFLFGKKGSTGTDRDKSLEKSVKKKITRKARNFSSIIAPYTFIAQSLTIDAVGDLHMFELFDTVRETNYYIQGAFDSDKRTSKMEFKVNPRFKMINEIVQVLGELEAAVDRFHTVTFSNPQSINIEELFMMNGDQTRLIFSLNRSEDRAVGTIALDKTIGVVDLGQKEPVQRPSLHRRTSQFLNARRHSSFIDAIERIYGQNLDIDTAKTEIIEGVLFPEKQTYG
ncbi:MAG: hypothetical protein ACFFE8_11020 [Candidatus Heimdallarchaeota archaeon]